MKKDSLLWFLRVEIHSFDDSVNWFELGTLLVIIDVRGTCIHVSQSGDFPADRVCVTKLKGNSVPCGPYRVIAK